MLSEIQGQPAVVARLRAAATGERLHHAFLIAGLPGSGVREVAARFAEALLCPVSPEGCGQCSACDRSRRGLHPDLLSLELDREGGAKEVKVEAVRALCGSLQLAPSEARRKVAVLYDADRMSASAQNALLKTLEEPPARTVMILAAENEDWLLPTVRSRCLRVGLHPPGRTLVTSGGRREQLVLLFETLLAERGKPGAALAALELAELCDGGREKTLEVVELLASLVRDVLVSQAGAPPGRLLAPERVQASRALATQLLPSELLRALEALEDAARAIDANGGPRLQVEGAALRVGGLA